MKGLLVGCLVLATLAGCNGIPHPIMGDSDFKGRLVVSSGFPLPYMFQGSAVQWNEDYAVTVKHIPLMPDVVHTCSSGCDLVFIRHKAEGPLPEWREFVKGEAVIAMGFSPLLVTVEGQGVAKGARLMMPGKVDATPYAVHDAPIVVGMSGGPVYGADGAVLGITVGMWVGGQPAFGELKSSARLSLFLPYEIVLREWQQFSMKGMAVAVRR